MGSPINPEMLVLARESRGLMQTDIARRLGVTQGHWSKVEGGLLPASDDQVEKLSTVVDYPSSLFACSDPIYGPNLSEFFHRKRKAAAARTVATIHARVNLRRIQVARLLRSAEIPLLTIPRLDADAYPRGTTDIAQVLRATWQLPRGPIKNLTRVIENAGGIVVPIDFGTSLVDAISRWVPGLPPLLFVNLEAPVDRQRLSLAHELGHLVLHSIPRDQMEQEANSFAAELLMPADEIRPQLMNATLPRLAALKPYWRTSMAALLHRAGDLGTISERTYRFRWMQMGKAGYRDREPAELDLSPEPPTLLHDLVRLHLDSFGYSIDQLADLVYLSKEEVISEYGLTETTHRPRMRVVRN